MPAGTLSNDTWGAENVLPRYIDNGIEDRKYSYWGGNILQGNDGKYHLFVCGWLENSPAGHHTWGSSIVFNAVADKLSGPYTIKDTIGWGHNPEVFRLKDGRYVLYVIGRRYIADNINGPWSPGTFDYDLRDRRLLYDYTNQTFARREDGSMLLICRGGGSWISETGLSAFNQLSDKSSWPPVEGAFEDPVVWRDHIQYHLIVNDWLGRIAYYLRSKDGVNWVVDPGEAYTHGFSIHEDGQVEDWFKYERMKVFQDEYGRAVQANFAVIDVLKNDDKGSDNHSSKNITIPLNPGLLLTILDSQPITAATKTIRVKIAAEKGFNPHTDIDLSALRFGASTEVNFGRGCKVKSTEKSGADLIVIFDAAGNGITADEFAPKLIGKTPQGKLLYGYARLPYVNYIEPILSARQPVFTLRTESTDICVEVQNFGQVASQKTTLNLEVEKDGKKVKVGNTIVPALKPYEKTNVLFSSRLYLEKGKQYAFTLTILSEGKQVSTYYFSSSITK
ncbi:hypothetical protein AGMMS49965_17530 [Bacteroidia bacterium]|nr:hypothetical protein AGMMS49965_17530 [Bacteroidia bacterium]